MQGKCYVTVVKKVYVPNLICNFWIFTFLNGFLRQFSLHQQTLKLGIVLLSFEPVTRGGVEDQRSRPPPKTQKKKV